MTNPTIEPLTQRERNLYGCGCSVDEFVAEEHYHPCDVEQIVADRVTAGLAQRIGPAASVPPLSDTEADHLHDLADLAPPDWERLRAAVERLVADKVHVAVTVARTDRHPCSRCGERDVINPRPHDDIVVCEPCMHYEWDQAVAREAAEVRDYITWLRFKRDQYKRERLDLTAKIQRVVDWLDRNKALHDPLAVLTSWDVPTADHQGYLTGLADAAAGLRSALGTTDTGPLDAVTAKAVTGERADWVERIERLHVDQGFMDALTEYGQTYAVRDTETELDVLAALNRALLSSTDPDQEPT